MPQSSTYAPGISRKCDEFVKHVFVMKNDQIYRKGVICLVNVIFTFEIILLAFKMESWSYVEYPVNMQPCKNVHNKQSLCNPTEISVVE